MHRLYIDSINGIFPHWSDLLASLVPSVDVTWQNFLFMIHSTMQTPVARRKIHGSSNSRIWLNRRRLWYVQGWPIARVTIMQRRYHSIWRAIVFSIRIHATVLFHIGKCSYRPLFFPKNFWIFSYSFSKITAIYDPSQWVNIFWNCLDVFEKNFMEK